MKQGFSNLLTLAGLFVCTGCAQLLGIDEVSQSGGLPIDAAVVDASPDAGLPFCADQAIPLGTTSVNTELDQDDFSISCSSGNGNDQAFLWKAPLTDYYVFNTQGSNFDTVLSLQENCMPESELACNNNRGEENISELVRKVEVDEAFIIVVDGFAGAQGVGKLNIERVSCPNVDIEGQSFPLAQSTVNAGDEFANTCGGAGQADQAYHWVVPEDGLWAFNARAPGFRSTISVIDGARCGDNELGCNASSRVGLQSEVVRRLSANQIVSIVVDGVDGEGSFDLDISKSEASCPDSTISLGVKSGGSAIVGSEMNVSYTPRVLSPGCAPSEITNAFNDDVQLRDYAFVLNGPPPSSKACSYSCDINVNSPGEFVAYILDQNDCGGNEIACEIAVDSGTDFNALLRVGPTEDQHEFTVVVSDMTTLAPSFSLEVFCQEACF